MKDGIEQRLAKLEPPKRGGQTRAIREQYEAIEAALARGVTRQQIVELLADEGVVVTLQFFKNALHRIRQEKKQGKPAIAVTPPKQQETTKPPPKASKEPEPKTVDAWQRIDEIAQSTPDLQGLRRQHLDSLKGKK